MKTDELMDAITELDDDLLNEAAGTPSPEEIRAAKKAGRRPLLFRTAAAAAVVVLALILVPVFRENTSKNPESSKEGISADSEKARSLAQPEYPREWTWEQEHENLLSAPVTGRRTGGREAADLYRGFFADTMLLLLSDEEEESAVMSPVNIFMATAMLAEITDGETRQEILDAIGVSDIDQLRDQAAKIWSMCYRDNGREKTILGNSLWLNNTILNYRESTLKQLADSYYASSFIGSMGSEAYDRLLQQWLTEMTGGLLQQQIEGLSLDPDSALALFSTVLHETRWQEEFLPQNTKPGVFHGPAGEIDAEFMFSPYDSTSVYYGENYSFVRKPTFQGSVWLFLPDEGVSVSEMMQAESFREFISTRFNQTDYYAEWIDGQPQDVTAHGITYHAAWVNLTVPKLDLSCEQDLTDALQKLGIRTAFTKGEADYTPVTDQPEVFLKQAKQGTRLIMDEEGISAASYVEYLAGAPAIEEEIDMVFDRPFFILVTGPEYVPLFAGVVNEP